ncbi:MAG: hypothetical protein R2874_11345 [Desulfobacterales bacterium]
MIAGVIIQFSLRVEPFPPDFMAAGKPLNSVTGLHIFIRVGNIGFRVCKCLFRLGRIHVVGNGVVGMEKEVDGFTAASLVLQPVMMKLPSSKKSPESQHQEILILGLLSVSWCPPLWS